VVANSQNGTALSVTGKARQRRRTEDREGGLVRRELTRRDVAGIRLS
jgi:hypothetical protein